MGYGWWLANHRVAQSQSTALMGPCDSSEGNQRGNDPPTSAIPWSVGVTGRSSIKGEGVVLWEVGKRFARGRDAQTAPAATSTAPGHQQRGTANAGNDTSRSTGHSGRQKAATRRNMQREERVTMQGPAKKQQRDGMSHRGGGGRSSPLTPGRRRGIGKGAHLTEPSVRNCGRTNERTNKKGKKFPMTFTPK